MRLVSWLAVVLVASACAGGTPSLELPVEPSVSSTIAGSVVGEPSTTSAFPSATSTSSPGEGSRGMGRTGSPAEELQGAFVSVSAGYEYSCGLREGGGVECWERLDPIPVTLYGAYWWELVRGDWSKDTVGAKPPAGVFASVSAGWGKACGLRPSGALECWGHKRDEMSSPPSGLFTEVSVGLEHACATRTDGQLVCWGPSYLSRLASFPPERVFTDFVVGDTKEDGFACGVREDRSVECWGSGYTSRTVPEGEFISLHGGGGWRNICGLRPSGEVTCWGSQPEKEQQNSYLLPPAGEFASILDVRYLACGQRPEGEVTCWREGRDGKVDSWDPSLSKEIIFGEGDACASFPHRVSFCFEAALDDPSEAITGIVMGYNFACGLRPSGEVICDYFDSLVSDRERPYRYPQGESPVEPPPGVFTALTVGEGFVCGLRTSGEVACWGANSLGESSPPGGRFTKVKAARSFACGLRPSGKLECWGYSGDEPSKVVPPKGSFASVRAGWGGLYIQTGTAPIARDWGVSCGLRNSFVKCWGDDLYGWTAITHSVPTGVFVEVGVGKEEACGLRPSGLVECWAASRGEPSNDIRDGDGEGYVALSVGGKFSCALRRGGSMDCWEAANRWYELPARTFQREGPYTSVSAGYEHQCGVLVAGHVECWSDFDIHGFGSAVHAKVLFGVRPCRRVGGCSPGVEVLEVSRGSQGSFVSVSAGLGYSCGLREQGGVECWEWSGGSLPEQWWGLEWAYWSDDPVEVTPPAGVFTMVSAGWGNACGLRRSGELECWGPNRSEVVSPPAGVFKEVSVGLEHACATRLDSSVTCWGSAGWRHPAILPPESLFTDFVLGDNFACGIRENSSVECWGQGFSSPRPPRQETKGGDFTRFDWRWEPPPVPSGAFVDIHSWREGACGLRSSGALECWSYFNYSEEGFWSPEGEFASILFVENWTFCGERADGELECWRIMGGKLPPPYPPLPGAGASFGEGDACGRSLDGVRFCFSVGAGGPPEEITGTVAGLNFACGLRPGGEAVCDYFDEFYRAKGFLGEYRFPQGASPVETPGGAFTVLVMGGFSFVCGLRPAGEVACWGTNKYGQSSPPEGKFTQIQAQASAYSVCGLRPAGEMECWGYGGKQSKKVPPRGPLSGVHAGWGGLEVQKKQGTVQGDGSASPDDYEQKMDWGYTCGLRPTGEAVCWGDDSSEPLPGDWSLLEEVNEEIAVTRLIPSGAFTQVGVGETQACGLRPTGIIECWGPDWVTPEGEGAFYMSEEKYSQLSVGGELTCALRGSGTVDCWNADESITHEKQGPYTVVSAGYDHQCGVLTTGDIQCWKS